MNIVKIVRDEWIISIRGSWDLDYVQRFLHDICAAAEDPNTITVIQEDLLVFRILVRNEELAQHIQWWVEMARRCKSREQVPPVNWKVLSPEKVYPDAKQQ